MVSSFERKKKEVSITAVEQFPWVVVVVLRFLITCTSCSGATEAKKKKHSGTQFLSSYLYFSLFLLKSDLFLYASRDYFSYPLCATLFSSSCFILTQKKKKSLLFPFMGFSFITQSQIVHTRPLRHIFHLFVSPAL